MRSLLAQMLATSNPGVDPYGQRLVEAAVLRVDELVSSAALHAGSEIEVVCRIEDGRDTGTEVEVICRVDDGRWTLASCMVAARAASAGNDAGSAFPVPAHHDHEEDEAAGRRPGMATAAGNMTRGQAHLCHQRAQTPAEYSMRLRLKRQAHEGPGTALSQAQTHECAMPTGGDQAQTAILGGCSRSLQRDHLGPSFLAEASELLAGQLDEELVAALAGQLLVPRVTDWCGVWLNGIKGEMRLSRVWHVDERLIAPLRQLLEQKPPPAARHAAGFPMPGLADVIPPDTGAALALPLLTAGTCQGMLVLGTTDHQQDDGVMRQVENMARLVAQAVATARQYSQQTTISRALQRRQLPTSLPHVPGVDTAVIYEPHEVAQTVGGDFYDLFPKGDGRWCFLVGDVQGKDPEAMSITGLTRHMVRLWAREGHGVESVLERLNITLAEESAEASGEDHGHGRFLTMLYGELEPDAATSGVHCRLASAGHPLPLQLLTNGAVKPAAKPQLLLGVDGDAQFSADSFDLMPGEALLCVTDGVTERRRGRQLFDDDDGLSKTLHLCAGMSAMAVAQRVRQAVHDFSSDPIGDDLAVLVLKVLPPTPPASVPSSRMPSA
ncbi:PP2C family protein-serine/threonine phosphatase [Streptomyces sp. NPDC058255]|uniref:PP2C family protein-serine/threonine phosphatase n=1 Tax=Streptomyces sp. NPDC058255 TaxID=3346407 RepID=UPI0036E0FAC9